MSKDMKRRKHNLLHRVNCACCGKAERIEIKPEGAIPSGWKYFGRVNVNTCQTDKFFWKVPEGVDWKDTDKWKKVPNACYDPKAKKKLVEYWECPECYGDKSK